MNVTQFLLIIHLLAISIGLGIGFTNLVNMRVARSQTGDVAKGLMMHRMTMLPYGDAMFVIILLSGGLLLWAIGGPAGLPQAFNIKMIFVVIWAITFVVMRLTLRQMIATRNMALAKRIGMLTQILLTAIVAAIVCAVLAFAS